MERKVLAFDFGASSGRATLGTYDGKSIIQNEIHRFENAPVKVCGALHWDVLRLFYEVKSALSKASHSDFESVGIDSWGVDFGLLDKYGNLVSNPVHYRDARNAGMSEERAKIISEEELFSIAGIQTMDINTINQLLFLKKNQPEILEGSETLLMMSDLFNYFLTGKARSEYTLASTSQLLDAKTRDWSLPVLERLGIPRSIFAKVARPGERISSIEAELCEELGIKSVPVISVASHDTQSAMAAIPSESGDFLFVSCGTWALMGTQLESPNLSEEARASGFSNEGGFGGVSFLTNITGTWLLQECRRHWQSEGQKISYDDLEEAAKGAKAFLCFVDPRSQDFVAQGDMPKRIQNFCKKTGQPVPQTKGEIARCVYESLAFAYRSAKEKIESLARKKYSRLHIVGGGTKSAFLCQASANACGVPVIAGPAEASVLGNIGVQMIALKILSGMEEFKSIVRKMPDVVRYESENSSATERAYEKFKQISGEKKC